ncbi:MAG TPA: carbon starvation protein A, partial [Candidatus Sumerlaeota bacterium]|nr:carbon starvation protein A [Candidatus Sumerlaeota bacterium]
MTSALIAVGAGLFYILAYFTYGRWLGRRIFRMSRKRVTPAHTYNDGVDYVPSRAEIVFGHHFTSIAGTGPIVGPAIAIIWGWVPALLWVLLGSVIMGGVHDFGALAISLRSRGRSVADICGTLINPRVRILFYAVIFFELWVVIAIFCLVIAAIFSLYPASVFPVWAQIPIAVLVGLAAKRKETHMAIPALIALALMYLTMWLGTRFPSLQIIFRGGTVSPTLIWTSLLLVYCFIASVLPVQWLLQPRDYINANQLMFMLVLLFLGVATAEPAMAAPALNLRPHGAPPIFPFLFITIACGAISGFHALVSSGVSSKQLDNEADAVKIGYGGMLLEGYLSVLVIIAVAAGIGMIYKTGDGHILAGRAAWNSHYASWGMADTLGGKLRAFVEGGANMMSSYYLPKEFGVAMLGVFVASFASTTLDSATRLQRYVLAEFGEAVRFRPLSNRYIATGAAVISALALAVWDIHGPQGWNLKGCGKGGMTLWPLFGAINQLLAGITLMVLCVWLIRARKPLWITAFPMFFMIIMTAWAMQYNLREFYRTPGQMHLFWIG